MQGAAGLGEQAGGEGVDRREHHALVVAEDDRVGPRRDALAQVADHARRLGAAIDQIAHRDDERFVAVARSVADDPLLEPQQGVEAAVDVADDGVQGGQAASSGRTAR